jgi:hypothetical protein
MCLIPALSHAFARPLARAAVLVQPSLLSARHPLFLFYTNTGFYIRTFINKSSINNFPCVAKKNRYKKEKKRHAAKRLPAKLFPFPAAAASSWAVHEIGLLRRFFAP